VFIAPVLSEARALYLKLTYIAKVTAIMATHIERAIEKIQVKEPTPIIDFTQHTLEDGNVISTQERVVKDVRISSL